jgi:hypothetical protein
MEIFKYASVQVIFLTLEQNDEKPEQRTSVLAVSQ